MTVHVVLHGKVKVFEADPTVVVSIQLTVRHTTHYTACTLCQLTGYSHKSLLKQAVREAATICPSPLQGDLLILKVMSESRVTWATSEPILVFLGLSVLDLGPMYVTDRHHTHHRLMSPPYGGGDIITCHCITLHLYPDLYLLSSVL